MEDYKDKYIKERELRISEIKKDKEKLYKLIERSYEIEEKNNTENQKTIRFITTMFFILLLIICLFFAFIKTKSDTDITNTNTNINTAHKGGDRNGG